MNLSLSIKFIIYIAIFAFINLITISNASAGTIAVNQALDFGKFILTNNDAPRSVDILFNSGHTADPQYVFFIDPQKGLVTVTDFPPLTALNVSVGLTNLDQGGVSSDFSISNTFTKPLTVTTDATGSATFEVGATLTSDGAGGTHAQGTYNGSFTITVTP